MMNKEQALKQIEQALKILKQEEPENTYRKPEFGEDYYSIEVDGNIDVYTWTNDEFDNSCYNFGNVFLTRKEAEKEARARSLVNKLHIKARYGKNRNQKCTVYCNNGRLNIGYPSYKCKFLEPTFNSEEAAQEAINKYRDELIWYFTEYMEG